MLCITMKIRLDRLSDERVHLAIQAPRELPILRGNVLEREGGERPGCVWGKASVSNG